MLSPITRHPSPARCGGPGDATVEDGFPGGEGGDVFGGGAVEGAVDDGDVGELAGLEGADAVVHADGGGGVDGVGAERFVERQAVFGADRCAVAGAAGHRGGDGVQWAEAGDEGVAGENRTDTRVELGPQRLQAMGAVAQMAQKIVAGVDEEIWLVDRE